MLVNGAVDLKISFLQRILFYGKQHTCVNNLIQAEYSPCCCCNGWAGSCPPSGLMFGILLAISLSQFSIWNVLPTAELLVGPSLPTVMLAILSPLGPGFCCKAPVGVTLRENRDGISFAISGGMVLCFFSFRDCSRCLASLGGNLLRRFCSADAARDFPLYK